MDVVAAVGADEEPSAIVEPGELARRGVEQITGVKGGPESGQYWCYFRDPEGNLFELIQPLQ